MDIFMRSLSLHIYATKFLEELSQEEYDILKAYSDGVNAYVAQASILPLEFWLTWSNFEPWKVEHSLMVMKLLEFHLASSHIHKAFKARVAELIGIDFMKELVQVSPEYQFYDDIITVIQPEDIKEQGLLNDMPHSTKFTKKNIRNNINIKSGLSSPTGMSDSWAISGNFTKSGKPLIANDPHLTHKMPGIWYYVTLKYPDNIITGFSVPGVPAVVIGRNEHVAWGFTASGIENVDLYWLDVNENERKYLYNGTWIPLESRLESIKVKNGQNVRMEFYTSHHGPVIMKTPLEASTIYMFGTTTFLDSPYAMNWNGFNGRDGCIEAAFGLMFAKNSKDVENALKNYNALAAAAMFATDEGDIGFRATSKVPIRTSYEDLVLIRNGSLPENDNIEYIPDDEMPHVLNPKSGYIVGCNQQLVPLTYKHIVGTAFPTTGRSHRTNEILRNVTKEKKQVSIEFMKEMQLDMEDSLARELCKLLVPFTKKYLPKYFSEKSEEYQTIDHMLKIVESWDHKMTAVSKGALVFNMWNTEIMNGYLKEQISDPWIHEVIVQINTGGQFLGKSIQKWNNGTGLDNIYCVNNETKNKKDPCAYNVIYSLYKVKQQIVKSFGNSEDNWMWGYALVIRSLSDTFSSTPFRLFFERDFLSHVFYCQYIREQETL